MKKWVLKNIQKKLIESPIQDLISLESRIEQKNP